MAGDQESLVSGDELESESGNESDNDSESNLSLVIIESKSSKPASAADAKAEAMTDREAATASTASSKKSSRVGQTIKRPRTESQARKLAKRIQQDPSRELRPWQDEDRDGDPLNWPNELILFDPVSFPECETAEEFWAIAPKYVYYSDRAVQLALAVLVSRGEISRYIGGDFRQGGCLYERRLPRGLPALDNKGNMVEYMGKWLTGDPKHIEIDEKADEYDKPQIKSANSSRYKATDKGPDPVWSPHSLEEYLALHRPTPIAATSNVSASSNTDVTVTESSSHAASNGDSVASASVTLIRRSKRCVGDVRLTISPVRSPNKRIRIEVSPPTHATGSRVQKAASKPSDTLPTVPIPGQSRPSVPIARAVPNVDSAATNRSSMSEQQLMKENRELKNELEYYKKIMREQGSRKNHGTTVANLQAQIASLKQQHSQELIDLKQKHRIEIERLQEEGRDDKAKHEEILSVTETSLTSIQKQNIVLAGISSSALQLAHVTAEADKLIEPALDEISERIVIVEQAVKDHKDDPDDLYLGSRLQYQALALAEMLQKQSASASSNNETDLLPQLRKNMEQRKQKLQEIDEDLSRAPSDVRDAIKVAGISDSLYDAD